MTRHLAATPQMVILALACVASSAAAREYPPAFPRDGAKKILDNEMITVWDVTWEKGKTVPMHQLRFDQVSVALTEGAVKINRPDKTSTIDFLRHGSVRLESKGAVFAEEGVSDKPTRLIVIEMKSYALPKLDPKITEGFQEAKAKGIPPEFPREGTVKLFENDRFIAWDDTLVMGLGRLHAHYSTALGIFMEPGVLASKTARSVGDVVFSPAHLPPHQEEVTKGPLRAIFIQFK